MPPEVGKVMQKLTAVGEASSTQRPAGVAMTTRNTNVGRSHASSASDVRVHGSGGQHATGTALADSPQKRRLLGVVTHVSLRHRR